MKRQAQNGRKYLQNTYLIKSFTPEYIKNPPDNNNKGKISHNFKNWQKVLTDSSEKKICGWEVCENKST